MRILLILFIVFIYSCSSEHTKNRTLNPGNLPAFITKIDHNKNNLFRTPRGAVIQIKKGTFDKDVELEIKEAYTTREILLAGLTTMSNGHPLRSGGMIYINTVDREPVKLNQPISIAIPAVVVDANMQLYKGEVQTDSSINWNKTDTVNPITDKPVDDRGRIIFMQNCATCHSIFKVITGPALAGIENRGPWRSRAELHRFVHNPGAYIPRTAYTQELQKAYNQIMPASMLSDRDIDLVFDYIKNQENLPKDSIYASDVVNVIYDRLADSVDKSKPCNDTIYHDVEDTATIPNEMVEDVFADTSQIVENNSFINDSINTLESRRSIQKNGFTEYAPVGGYLFKINTLGWYNVDMEIDGEVNTVLCKVSAQVPTEYEPNLNVFLLFPKQKLILNGYAYDKGNYSFSGSNPNGLNLFLGEDAILIAFGGRGETFYYGTTHFKVKKDQNISIPVHNSTQEELLNAIKSEKIEGINMDVIKMQMEIVPCGSKSDTTKAMK